MTTPTQSEVTLEESGRTWDQLTGQIDAFVAAWEAEGAAPTLAAFVPEAPQGLRHLVLVELIKVDLDYRWSRPLNPRRLEDYLREFPELQRAGVPAALLYEEFHIRKRSGDAVCPEEFLARFPKQAAELARLLHLQEPEQSLSLSRPGKELAGIEAGQQLDDFDLLAALGQGAFARVFLARQRSMQRLVALKVSTVAPAAVKGGEAQTLAQLDHPQIVRVYDQRLLPEQSLRLLYMQYLPGGDLHKVIGRLQPIPGAERTGQWLLRVLDQELRRRGEEPPAGSALRRQLARMSWPEVVCWMGARLAAALAYAHDQGVLHRDVKPANVLLTAEGVPKLVDFNISCCSKLEGANPAAFFGGSLAYMSPEQLEACNPAHPSGPEVLDGRSDLYSLAVTLWELLTGRRPFPEERLAAEWSSTLADFTARRRAGVEPAVIAQLPAGCPPGLAHNLLACLAPDRGQRPESGQELAWQLDLCLQPDARRLLNPPAHGWQKGVASRAVLAVLLATLVPNIVAALINFSYNRQEIVARLPGGPGIFWRAQLAINGTAFPVGLVALGWVCWPVGRALRRLRRGESIDGADLLGARRRCLKLGHLAAMFSLTAWLLAGLAYPVSIASAGAGIPALASLHFIASLALCGLIASAYPFFFVTYLSVRALYPALARPGRTTLEEAAGLAGLNRLLGPYLLLAALVPLLAVLALVLIGSENRWAMIALSAGGLVGVSVVFVLFRAIQGDLAALARVMSPAGERQLPARETDELLMPVKS